MPVEEPSERGDFHEAMKYEPTLGLEMAMNFPEKGFPICIGRKEIFSYANSVTSRRTRVGAAQHL